MTAAICTDNLCKYYGQVKALDGLSLSVAPGTVFGFLGPNGAGKSTTIRLLTGLAHPTSGSAQVAGVDVSQHSRLAHYIGFLGEEPAFYNWMTPAEFLDHVGRVFGLKSAERKARTRQLLEQAGLADVSKRRIGGFSRGMRQRLGIAQALINHPDVLFLDEPASALDPAGRKEVLEMIAAQRGEATVFMSTHILADVERVCDTVGIINHGKMVVEAKQSDLLASYTIPAYELECEPGTEESFKITLEALRKLNWVSKIVSHNGGSSARVVVKDLEIARKALMPLVVANGAVLRRYEAVTPSLEDVFLRLVGQEEEK
jgi:ABC-2 type transport system ATP-binding protein